MSLILVLLAAGDSKRFNSNTPKLYYKINNKTLLEHSFNAFSSFIKIKKTIINHLYISKKQMIYKEKEILNILWKMKTVILKK